MAEQASIGLILIAHDAQLVIGRQKIVRQKIVSIPTPVLKA